MRCSEVLLLLLCLCLGSALSEPVASQQSVKFYLIPVCPANSSRPQLTRLEGARDARTCHVACASAASCSALHHANGICYFGNSTQISQHFTLTATNVSSPCASYIKASNTVESKLVVFYNFKQGFSNLIRPGTFDAAPKGAVTRDSQGALFPGDTSSFIEVDTLNGSLATRYLDGQRNFSFFAKVIRQTFYQQSYHYFYDCAAAQNSGRFGDRDGLAWIEHQFPLQALYMDRFETRQSSAGSFRSDNTPQLAAVGAAFSGLNLTSFYLNGSTLPTDSDLGFFLNNYPRCLRLGFDTDVNCALKGRMICYAIAKEALDVSEFQHLEKMCQ